MSGAVSTTETARIPEFQQVMGHPRPLWMLFMTEFWERFAFYGLRWAFVLYIVAEFYGGDPSGEAPANLTYGAYLALVYAGNVLGGYVADRVLGYQRSILVGAIIMAAGLFLITVPDQRAFGLGLATIIVGNGLFKPIISTLVGKVYVQGDPRRDPGFTIFYMGINAGGFFSPIVTGWLAVSVFGTELVPAYKVVFFASGVGMLISLAWFWFGRAQLKGIGTPAPSATSLKRVAYVFAGALVAIPVVYFLLALGAGVLQWILTALFLALAALLLVEGIRNGAVQRDKVIAMLIIFTFNVLFWMFFEQAGSSFNFLADKIVDRDFGGWVFPTGWFQSVNPVAILFLAPVVAWVWTRMGNASPSIPRKFSLGLIGNGLAFLLLMFTLSSLVDETGMIPFWTLFMVYVIQSIGELCLSPVGLSMVTKLAPVRLVGFAMGGWFLSTGIGNNLSGIFAGHVSGETGISVESAYAGYTFGFWALLIAGGVLFLIAPLMQRLTHGVK